jgi:hypothetical protein
VLDAHLIDETTVIKDHIVDFYKKLYCKQYQWRPRADDLSFLSIDDGEFFFGWNESLRKMKFGR